MTKEMIVEPTRLVDIKRAGLGEIPAYNPDEHWDYQSLPKVWGAIMGIGLAHSMELNVYMDIPKNCVSGVDIHRVHYCTSASVRKDMNKYMAKTEVIAVADPHTKDVMYPVKDLKKFIEHFAAKITTALI